VSRISTASAHDGWHHRAVTTPRDPVADLRRIAFLLERAHESTYRVRAFRGAAAALRARDRNELEALAASGELRRLRGVGDVTARCVVESLAGEEPAYLSRLLADEGTELADAAADLRAALRGDCHSHTDASDGGSPLPEMVETARELGHDYLVITDHSPRLTVANGLSADRLRAQIGDIAELNLELGDTGFRVLTGIEVDILDDGNLDQDPDLLAELDVVVASVHSKLRMPAAEMTERMLTAIVNPDVDVLGHCTGRMVTGTRSRPESQFDAAAVFAACAEHGVAVEINSRPERLDPPKRLLRLAVEAGCTFTIDTDAHAPGQLDWLDNGCSRAAECGVPADRVLNTWPVERLLEHTG
jgi:putative hydrolase